jgi:DNA-binding transcriptional ArsR family regulator
MEAIKVIEDPEKFQLLADGTRRKIVFLLRATEMTAGQMASTLDVTAQTIYHHLKKLQKADLVNVSRTEQIGHLTESYYRATAEAFLCSVGTTPKGREFFEKQMKTTLDSLVKIGFNLKYSEDDVQRLIEKQDEILKCCSRQDYEENIKDKLDNIDDGTLSIIDDYAKLITMTDKEFGEQQRLKREFRDALKSLINK